MNLAIARKVILCAGLLTAALLFLYPHWWISVEIGKTGLVFTHDAGRGVILSPPLAAAQTSNLPMIGGIRPSFRINYVRLFIEVAVALLLTFGLMRALRTRSRRLSSRPKAATKTEEPSKTELDS